MDMSAILKSEPGGKTEAKKMVAAGRMSGMEKLFRGILIYREKWKQSMVEKFMQVRDNPNPAAVFFTCIDSRMLPTRFTSTNVGDMIIVRNAANMVPNSATLSTGTSVSTEAAALELGCVMNKVKHIVVCGHSDCKAMNLLYTMRQDFEADGTTFKAEVTAENLSSPMRQWLRRYGAQSLSRFNHLQEQEFRVPLMLKIDPISHKIPAYIDSEFRLNDADKLSQINTLVQMENVASYPFMAELVKKKLVDVHAFWFDVYSGEIFYFSRRKKHFVPIIEQNVEEFLQELGDFTAESEAEELLKAVNNAREGANKCHK